MIYDCIVIGAGASGLFFTATLETPVHGLVLEKTGRTGTKLLMSGNGQCNVTHSGSIKDFIGCYGKNGKKIRSCLYKGNNLALISFLEDNGIKTLTRNDGKVFPASMKASDILELLIKKTGLNGFDIKLRTAADRIEKKDFGWQVFCGGSSFCTKALVIASGGCSYPSTGSDGSFFTAIKALGIDVTELKPALSSIRVENYPYGSLSGISFENARVSIWRDNKKLAESSGGLLFTHTELSGPAVMNISKFASPGDRLDINYLSPLSQHEVQERIKESVMSSGGSTANIISRELCLPRRFCQLLAAKCGESIKKLSAMLTGESFIISSVSGFKSAMCTCGGVSLNEIDAAVMEVKKHPSLFIIGEALDIDGITGGYNLQFAYSSARAAGRHISAMLSEQRR